MTRITPEAYQAGIARLIHLAYTDQTSARVAAQVLLSAYNGEQWQLDIVDLTLLDRENYQAALNVIRGRVEVNCEPQHMIQNGSSHFRELWGRYQYLHVSKRGKER